MKTPKRNKGNGYGAACCPYEGPNQTAFEHARWKRKNRIKQLKRTMERLTQENAILKHTLGTHLFNKALQEFDLTSRTALEFLQKHVRVAHMGTPTVEYSQDKDGNHFVHIRREPPVITWDNTPIGPVADWYKKIKN